MRELTMELSCGLGELISLRKPSMITPLLFLELLACYRRHRCQIWGHGLNRRTLVYDKDVAGAAVLALEHSDAAGRIYNVSDGGFHTMNEIVAAICAALGRKPPRFSLPIGPVRTLVGLIEKGSQAIGLKPPVTKAIIDKYTEDIAVDGSLIQNELGFVPHYDLKTGWSEAVETVKQQSE